MAKNAFTLIELLIVIAIIAILAGIIVATLGNPTADARDSTRMNDVDAIGDAAQQYMTNHTSGAYPDTIAELESAGYLSAVPTDPDDGSNYMYAHCEVGGNPRVVVGATLENTTGKATEDADASCDDGTIAPAAGGGHTIVNGAGVGDPDVIDCATTAAAGTYCVAR